MEMLFLASCIFPNLPFNIQHSAQSCGGHAAAWVPFEHKLGGKWTHVHREKAGQKACASTSAILPLACTEITELFFQSTQIQAVPYLEEGAGRLY